MDFAYAEYLSISLTLNKELFIYISASTITVHTNRLDAAVNDLVFLTTWQTGQDGPYLFDLQGVGWKKANTRIS